MDSGDLRTSMKLQWGIGYGNDRHRLFLTRRKGPASAARVSLTLLSLTIKQLQNRSLLAALLTESGAGCLFKTPSHLELYVTATNRFLWVPFPKHRGKTLEMRFGNCISLERIESCGCL
uniref:Uncharacterized protein n=1 Tax=Mucochytrium quahogii TaxID=96639 RepID=A0A7S2WAZ7_9STRA|mmetsp:Transcript_18094/g.30813  ORF Transcript_18094/g.30813 Transcript_18094/m.30813 type:complete len:119 (+) Transcript_18094:301-657(+)